MRTFHITIDCDYTAVDDEGNAYGRPGSVDVVEQGASPHTAKARTRAAFAAIQQGTILQVRVMPTIHPTASKVSEALAPSFPRDDVIPKYV